MKPKVILAAWVAVFSISVQAQSLEKMQWFNEPESYHIKSGVLEMDVPAQTDYWRIAAQSTNPVGRVYGG